MMTYGLCDYQVAELNYNKTDLLQSEDRQQSTANLHLVLILVSHKEDC